MPSTIDRDGGAFVMSGSHQITDWHLAQINVGRLVAPHGDPRVAPFFEALDRVNLLAERSPGFVWRLQSETGNATDIQSTSDPMFIVNMSVWLNAEALFNFVYQSAHTPEMARRREYFERFGGAYQALWWVPAGYVPGLDEGLSRLGGWIGTDPRAKRLPSRCGSRLLTLTFQALRRTWNLILGVWDGHEAARTFPFTYGDS
jgi:hypothetical protein